MQFAVAPVSILLALSACGRGAPARDIGTADELIARHIEAIGGRDAWMAVKVVSAHGVYEEGETRERHRLDRMRPDKIRITTRYDAATGEFGYAEGYDGSAWEYRARVPIRVTGMPALALRRASAFDPQFLDYAAKGIELELVGRARLLDREVYQLRITGVDGGVSDVYFDVDSLMHVMSRAVAPHHGEGRAIEIVSIRDDFREVDGVAFAHRHVERALPSGAQLSTLRWERIEVNGELPDDWFSPPVSEAAAQYQRFRRAALEVRLGDLSALLSAYLEVDRAEADRRRESELNTLGYELLSHERFAAAITVFELALGLYPASANLHDSLGEAYMLAGDVALAIESYRRSIELDPKNDHGVRMIEKLENRAPNPL